ncbi:MAG: fibronectin type III domain-containing protein [Euryarchaeota archaeon]|nr:fibronectin type III domain-containing protein [Euryarchaeota archaeon]
MTRSRVPPTGRLFTTMVIAGTIIGGALGFALPIEDPWAEVRFDRSTGLSTQSGHAGDPLGLVTLVETLEDTEDTQGESEKYVKSLDVFVRHQIKEYGDADVTLIGGLARVRTDASDLNVTTIQVGGTEVVLGDVLRQVPEEDVWKTLKAIDENGTKLVDSVKKIIEGDGGDDEPPKDPGDPTSLLDEADVYVGHGPVHATLIIQAKEQLIQLIVRPGTGPVANETIGGLPELNVAVAPGLDVRYGDAANDTILELSLWNPITHLGLGEGRLVTPTLTLDCARERLPNKVGPAHNPVRAVDPCQTIVRNSFVSCAEGTTEDCERIELLAGQALLGTSSLVAPDPQRLLHLRAYDNPAPGGTVTLHDGTHTSARGTWGGDPFGEGVWFAPEGGEATTFSIGLPSATERTLSYSLSGPIAKALGAQAFEGDHDLEQLDSEIEVGPVKAGALDAYRVLDVGSGLIRETWRDGQGKAQALRVLSLLDTAELFRIVQDTYDTVIATADAVHANITYQGARIEERAAPVFTDFDGLLSDTSVFAVWVVNNTTDRLVAIVDFVQGATGCTLEPAGCLGIDLKRYQPTVGEPGYSDPVYQDPPSAPVVRIGDQEIDNAENLRVWVDTAAGWAVAVAPKATAPGVSGCLPALSGQLPECDPYRLDAVGSDTILGAAVGSLSETNDLAFTLVRENKPPVVVVSYDGEEKLRVGEGQIHVLGHGVTAGGGDGHLVTITRPDDDPIVIQPSLPGWVGPFLPGGPNDPIAPPSIDLLENETIRTFQESIRYERNTYGEYSTITVTDPGDPDTLLFRYHDDGDTVTISSAFDHTLGAQSHPSGQVAIVGDPIAGRYWRIETTGAKGVDLVSAHTFLTNIDGTLQEKGLSPGVDLSILYDISPVPDRSFTLKSGATTLRSIDGDFDGTHWASGLRPAVFEVDATMPDDDPMRLELYGFDHVGPHYSNGLRVPAALVGWDEETGRATYRATLDDAHTEALNEGDTVRFALAWSERHGPVSAVLLDDGGDHWGYAYRADTAAPTAMLDLAALSETTSFPVSWSAPADTGSGLSYYTVQYAAKTTPSDEEWSSWVNAMPISEGTTATFTGDAGKSYTFRAHACDTVDNCGDWSNPAGIRIAEAAEQTPPTDREENRNDAPTLRILEPRPGATVSGTTTASWDAVDPELGDVVVNLDQRADDDAHWQALYSGTSGTYAWDTTGLTDGLHHLRATATDGTRQSTEEWSVWVKNGVLEPSLDGFVDRRVQHGTASGDANDIEDGGGDETGGSKKDSPGPAFVLVIVSLVVLVGFLRRRR